MKYQTYTKYKPSGIECLEAIPDGWHTRRLKSIIFSIDNGQWGEDELGDGSDWVVLRVADFGEKEFNLKKELTMRSIANKKLRLRSGDLVIEKSGGGEKQLVGRVVQFVNTDNSKKYTYSNFVGKLIIGNEVDNRFLLYFFKSFYNSQKNYRHIKQTTGIQNLDADSLLQTEYIALPAISDQQKIVDFLDKKTSQIDGLIKKDKRLIELLQERRIALINQAVTKGLDPNAKLVDSGVDWIGEIPEGWEVRKLKFAAQICNGQDQKDVLIDEGGYPVYGTGGEFGRASKYLYNKKSVLLGRKGTIDKPQFAEEPFWTVDTLFYTRIFKETFPKYFYYTTRCIDFYKYSETTTVPSMTQEKLNEILFPYPKYSEQKKIAEYIDNKTKKIDNHIKGVVKRIGLLNEYKKSLIYNAVTGKIKV